MGMELWDRSRFITVSRFILPLLVATQCFLSVQSRQTQALCHADDRFALLQFKESITIDKAASGDPFGYPKVESWTQEGHENESDCCSWDGVECGGGHVTGLDLSSSCLYGSINSTSSLFQLVHLKSLDLSDNHFNFSQLPSSLGHLTSLTYLNLSMSAFSGQIPSQLSKLSKLSTLDLSYNYNLSLSSVPTELAETNLGSLVRNFTNIKQLHLNLVVISSRVPHILLNVSSSLTSLKLYHCHLYGEFPGGIFHLPSLQVLDLSFNNDLTGYLPNFNSNNSLMKLNVALTSFAGQLPNSIGNLHSLNSLDISDCFFHPYVPSSLSNLTQLIYLDISAFYDSSRNFSTNQLASCSWSWLGKQTKLYHLGLQGVLSGGNFPSFLANLRQLAFLNLQGNKITGPITSWLMMRLTKLVTLNLGVNNLQEEIPTSIFQLQNLESLDLSSNDLTGIVEFDQFFKFKKLKELVLSDNNISLKFKTNLSAAVPLPQLASLGLASCNLTEFPAFLKYQNELEQLDLSLNNIHGHIPIWLWNASRETMMNVILSKKFLTGFEQDPGFLAWQNLSYFSLNDNMILGSLPIPPKSIIKYDVGDNGFSGEVSPLFCELNDLHLLDLSNNSLSGNLPHCLGKSKALGILLLAKNSFDGEIPPLCSTKENYLVGVDLSYNKLEGKIPRSMGNCTHLEFLNLRNNQMSDIFPSWLGALPLLWAFNLRSNGFNGMIGRPTTKHEFPKLRILDLSKNGFSGMLPSNYLKSWNAMKIVDEKQQTYVETYSTCDTSWFHTSLTYELSFSIFGKGVELKYLKTPYSLKLIDLSSNRFEGEIPAGVIGNLRGLVLLDLSNNTLTGHIPSTLGNLTALESLDLSHNQLSGKIPSNLVQLNFLAYLNVSHNNLSGPIPVGKQFDTFQNESYEGNSGLCGLPLSKKCEDDPERSMWPPSSDMEEDDDSGFHIEWDWFVVLPGVVSGLIVGVVAGNIWTSKNHEWFVETFSKRRQPTRRGAISRGRWRRRT